VANDGLIVVTNHIGARKKKPVLLRIAFPVNLIMIGVERSVSKVDWATTLRSLKLETSYQHRLGNDVEKLVFFCALDDLRIFVAIGKQVG
jgi:hypothetical protein